MNIHNVVDDIAEHIGLQNLSVSLGKKSQINKISVHLLSLSTQDKKINTLITHEEIIGLLKGELTGFLKSRVELSLRSLMV